MNDENLEFHFLDGSSATFNDFTIVFPVIEVIYLSLLSSTLFLTDQSYMLKLYFQVTSKTNFSFPFIFLCCSTIIL